ncbi:hypothetical protein [Methylobacterium sp. 77]|uniref:hypothetical protein n=1 Tax=Methylobacterium sp. 77 TaxID=1101192 RepID=UPI000364E7C7|nr:hypothetical protein [Methylobacterium sp. 77]
MMLGGTLQNSPYDVLTLIEDFGIVGYWGWNFVDDTHYWSPGLCRIVGIPVELVRPDYRLLFQLIHPDDCAIWMDPRYVRHGGTIPPVTFRILRPDTTICTVMSRVEVKTSPGGKRLSARGILIDVSDRETLARAEAEQRRRDRAIFETTRAFTSTTTIYPFTKFSDEWLTLVGMPEAELLHEPTLPVLKDERRYWRDHGRESYLAKRLVHTTPNIRLANGETATYRLVMIPMLDEAGSVESWTNFVSPIHLNVRPTGRLLAGLEQRIGCEHVRAARALLDWSMTDLSKASAVSLSTIRRLEGRTDAVTVANRNQVVAALRRAGIVFSLDEGARVTVGKGS